MMENPIYALGPEFTSQQSDLLAEYGKLIFAAHLMQQNLDKISMQIAQTEEKLINNYNINQNDRNETNMGS